MTKQRLAAEERKQAIVAAVREVFARKGFDGTTTKELAQAAGVSEALLYKHFPSKESLYSAILTDCIDDEVRQEYERILALEPSVSTLVLLVHFYVSRMLLSANTKRETSDCLFIRSLLEDGALVRVKHQELGVHWHAKFTQSLKAAVAAGDAEAVAVRGDFAPWLAQSVALGLKLYLNPSKPVIETPLTKEAIAEQTVWFVLLGAGVKPEAIRAHYNPKGLALVAR